MSFLSPEAREARRIRRSKRAPKVRIFRHALPTGGWLVLFGKHPADASILKVCNSRAEADAYIQLISRKDSK